jgi:hypothetical protein
MYFLVTDRSKQKEIRDWVSNQNKAAQDNLDLLCEFLAKKSGLRKKTIAKTINRFGITSYDGPVFTITRRELNDDQRLKLDKLIQDKVILHQRSSAIYLRIGKKFKDFHSSLKKVNRLSDLGDSLGLGSGFTGYSFISPTVWEMSESRRKRLVLELVKEHKGNNHSWLERISDIRFEDMKARGFKGRINETLCETL